MSRWMGYSPRVRGNTAVVTSVGSVRPDRFAWVAKWPELALDAVGRGDLSEYPGWDPAELHAAALSIARKRFGHRATSIALELIARDRQFGGAAVALTLGWVSVGRRDIAAAEASTILAAWGRATDEFQADWLALADVLGESWIDPAFPDPGTAAATESALLTAAEAAEVAGQLAELAAAAGGRMAPDLGPEPGLARLFRLAARWTRAEVAERAASPPDPPDVRTEGPARVGPLIPTGPPALPWATPDRVMPSAA